MGIPTGTWPTSQNAKGPYLKFRLGTYLPPLKERAPLVSFRLEDDNDYVYDIFSILSIAHASTSVILAGKRGSRRHSTTSFSENVVVAGSGYQM